MTSDTIRLIIISAVLLISLGMITQCSKERDKQFFELRKAQLQQYG